MQHISVPSAIKHQPQINAGEISFVHYTETGSLFKNRVVFGRYAISFVLNGQKEIYLPTERTIVYTGHAMLIPEGNSLIAEHSLNDNKYSSFIVFFPANLVTDFLARQRINRPPGNETDLAPFITFASTTYLNEYVNGMRKLIDSQQAVSYQVALHKLEELLLVIYELFPAQLINMFNKNGNDQLSLKSIVEGNLFNKLTLDELAFLTNRSVSTFKRDFEKAYGISPQKYIRERKLEAACAELAKGRQASELYDNYGYENLSNFNTAFKRKFGLTPAAYRINPRG
ncbi:helix-turn-helix domain-containing protein [Mucilaginibacter agri]|uniref:Helix-turn-helix domain-containing protein n=1 Tax=Mucilaginibacter agri TaxID=2695265 RepID=A0A965ZDP6_9SPHI|nr:AraC family transcriptional regulator [Mucilaginibacter agri]NCD67776.1 helix-turn-helix domain-containing protein [Mucilaginibacter agri]